MIDQPVRRIVLVLLVVAGSVVMPPSDAAPQPSSRSAALGSNECDLSGIPGAVWWGPARRISLQRLAAYIAPVYWFSPDEPLLEAAQGRDIRIPERFPFDDRSDRPVVYYQFEEILVLSEGEESAYIADSSGQGYGTVDVSELGALRLSFFAYFRSEEGLGAHPHDIEPAEFKVAVLRADEVLEEYGSTGCERATYVLVVRRVAAKAHGLKWYWNVLDVDRGTNLPLHLLVEEGKHGLATDKNGDGYFSPGYDVSRYVNDAWGVRDVIRSGTLFTGGYQSWMTKVRHPEHRVLPPLPEDSPLHGRLRRDQGYRGENVEYALRPLPAADRAAGDRALYRLLENVTVGDWPHIHEATEFQEFVDWIEEGNAIKSLAISFRADGEPGFSFVLPFFIVKNLEAPIAGGFIVWRMYLKDRRQRDFGWMLMYMPSASRWIDTYLAAGAEWERNEAPDTSGADVDFVLETGLKFRVNVAHTPLASLAFFTDFWGVRLGVKNRGFFDIERLTYVIEVGAGAF